MATRNIKRTGSMTVKELMDMLAKLPPDGEISLDSHPVYEGSRQPGDSVTLGVEGFEPPLLTVIFRGYFLKPEVAERLKAERFVAAK